MTTEKQNSAARGAPPSSDGLGRCLMADELDAELHRCWTKHVNSSYDKAAFQSLQHKVEKASNELRRGAEFLALKRASYALFQIKCHVGVSDFTRQYASEESNAACKVIDGDDEQ